MTTPSIPEDTTQPVRRRKRTFGLWAVDALVYPFLNNITVFALSVAATYLTAHGGLKRADGSAVYGRTGQWFQRRGDWLYGRFRNLNLNDGQAKWAKTVFFSWLDGTLIAPGVKLLEDRREPFARAIDRFLGSEPADPAVYEAEPKQSWGSVIGGRALTAGIVVSVAFALDKAGLNKVLFSKPGAVIDRGLKERPAIVKRFGATLDGIGEIISFEAFYTSVCTAGLYLSSRFLATRLSKRREEKNQAVVAEEENLQPVSPVSPRLSIEAPEATYDGRVSQRRAALKHVKSTAGISLRSGGVGWTYAPH